MSLPPPLQSISNLNNDWIAKVLTFTTLTPTTVSAFSIEKDLDTSDGFLSSIYAVNVATNINNFSLVLKLLPDDKTLKEIVNELSIADRENEFYNFILEGSFHKIIPSNLILPIPKVYYSEYCNDKFTLVMENLIKKGYKSVVSPSGIDMISVTSAFKSIAQIHACGYRYLETHGPDSLRAFCTNEDNLDKILDEEIKIGLNRCCDLLKEGLLYDKLKIFCNLETYRSLRVGACNSHVLPQTIIHGDYWSGQTMSNEKNDVCIIDWQFVNFSNPTDDLASYLLMSCGEEILNNVEELLKVYSLTLNECLSLFKSERKFKLEDVKKSFETSLSRGLWNLLYSVNSFLTKDKISEERLLLVIHYADSKNLFSNKR